MIASNFTIKNSIYLVYDGSEYDLHNDYDFLSYIYEAKSQCISLKWKRGTGEWVRNGQPNTIELEIIKTSSFSVSPRRNDAPLVDDVCLEEIAYENDEEWCDGPFWVDQTPETTWRWIFMFESDYWLTVNAESISAKVKP